jgi:glutathione-independent formaldehyde dehydrogenase
MASSARDVSGRKRSDEGSDLHPYDGRAPLDDGMVLGHENMGIVAETGSGVNRVKVGDRVSVPFNLACGTCRNCNDGWTSACLRANPSGQPGAGYGYPQMGPYWGGQAEFLRVPWADFNLLELPAGREHESDFTMLSDIFPTGYHATELAQVAPGKTVAIFGAGPVGLMAAHSANIRGAAQTFVADFQPDRLVLAERIGATAINLADGDPVEAIMEATDGFGVDCGVEAVGFQAHDPAGQEHPALVLDNLVSVVRATGRIGVVGVYVPQDPDAATEEAKEGRVAFGPASATGLSRISRFRDCADPGSLDGGQAGSPGVAAALQVGPDRVGQLGGLLGIAGLICSLLITGLPSGLTGGYGRPVPGEVALDDGLLLERCHDGP